MAKAKTIVRAGITAVLIGLLSLLGTAKTAYAADYTWDNGSVADNNWSTSENWNPDGTPGAGDNVIFDATSDTDCIADNVSNNLTSISLNSGYTSTLTLNSNFVGGTSNELTLTGDLTVNSGTVLCKGDTSTTNGAGIIINAANMTVGENGLVSANGQGFGPTLGPGKGIRGVGNIGTGGGYGGSGGKDMDGDAGGSPYGTQSSPTALGSGGGTGLNATGGYGGGAVKLVASGTVTVDGTLSANGTGSGGSRAYNGGAGSGGSLWIASGTLTGSGTISAMGATVNRYYGIRYAGGGAGGRIDLSGTTYSFAGTITTAAGAGFQDGMPGSVLLPASYLNNVTLDHNITLGNDLNVTGSLTVETGATLTTGGDITVGTTLTVNSGGTIVLVGDTHDVNGGTAGNPHGSGPTVTAADIVIAAGGSIHADGQGFDGGQGPGKGIRGAPNYGTGGGYGGTGGNDANGDAGGLPYGTASAPAALGSGGGTGNRAQGGFGGGAIKLVVSGTVTVDGTLSANGSSSTGYSGYEWNGGAGSGGSIWIASGTLTGSGTISAKGATVNIRYGIRYAGAGAGGRIDLSGTTYNFTGTLTAAGGAGFQDGIPGSVLLPASYLNNLTLDHNITLGSDLNVTGSLTVETGATLTTGGNITVDNTLTVNNGGAIILVGDQHDVNGGTAGNPNGSGPTVTAADIMIAAGGSIHANGQGFDGRQGPGRGIQGAGHYGTGGGHGGTGGNDANGDAGGLPYGTALAPTALGSGGGTGNRAQGGFGGGAIKLVVSGTVTVDGTLSANGSSSTGYSGYEWYGGGGSGGSIWIPSGTVTGSGTISAKGATVNIRYGIRYAGGGAGGRIDLSGTTYNFTGTLTAAGGAGFQDGMAGSVFLPAGYLNNLTLDHNITLGSDLNVTGSLTIEGGVTLNTSGDITVGTTLTVDNGGTVILVGDQHDVNGGTAGNPNGSGPTVTAADIMIAAGGSIHANGQGFDGRQGPGRGIQGAGHYGTGGGHGGTGGKDANGDAGGLPYGTALAPTALGSGGGTGNRAQGGFGGGAIKLVVSGTVTVDGTLSANGSSSTGYSGYEWYGGGGSGGSIWIPSGTVTGSGTISAKGATVNIRYGIRYAGGGAGGRIDLSGTTYNFTGTLTAAGGAGFQDGETGTIPFPNVSDLTITGDINLYDDLNITGSLTVEAGATLTTGGDITVGSTVTVNSGGTIVLVGDQHDVNGGTAGNPYGSGPTIAAADIEIASGGSIHADGQGFGGQQGPGRGIQGGGHYGTGGGYGGNGGNDANGDAGGSPYGTASAPTALGSGGGRGNRAQGGFGGGAIKLVVTGTVTVDGTLSANGSSSTGYPGYEWYGGGGSGGSLWITSGTVTGSGVISAKGATVNIRYGIRYAGGGAGGRIDLTDTTYNFTGTLTAAGGAAFQDGMPGSVLLPASYLNNLALDHNITLGSDLNVTGSLIIEDGVTLTTGGDISVGTTLTVDSGGTVILVGETHDVNGGTAGNPYGSGPTIAAADIVIAEGGSIHADRQGFDGQQGPGRGVQGAGHYGTGGGYGGNGGNDANGDPGGSPYGTASAPTALGSGGGRGNRAQGGFGGGAIKLVVSGTVSVEGILSANGGSSTGYSGYQWYGGAGSGGSIWIDADTLTGTGTISAKGATVNIHTGLRYAGGGGGGRIYAYLVYNTFNGAAGLGGIISVPGGNGFEDGEEGTIRYSFHGDFDGDGMADGWELFHGVSDPNADEDSDGLNNLGEYQNDTHPHNPDCDGDNLTDGDEILNNTDPHDVDTDDDNISDGWEVTHGFDPLDPLDPGSSVKIWDNDSGDGLWSTPSNWSSDALPVPGDMVVFMADTVAHCTGDAIPNNLQDILLDFGYTGTLTIKQDSIGGADTLAVTGDVTVNQGNILCEGDPAGGTTGSPDGEGVTFQAANVTVGYLGRIHANGQGFPHDAGPGTAVNAGDCSGGGGYGGKGGNGRDSAGGPTYGTMYEPDALGSGGAGGASAGSGGGAIKFEVTNTITVQGTISANGANGSGNYPGGSGGSIWLVCDTLTGNGFIIADGGNGGNTTYPGGGGGGRIRLNRVTYAYTCTIEASGGSGRSNGLDGTVYDTNPFLQWTGEASYESDGLDPEWGKENTTTFTYRIKYVHPYDIAPTAIYVHILKDGSEIGTSPFELFGVDAGDTIYADGKLYSRSLTLDTKGNYTYYFETQAVGCGPAMGEGSVLMTGPAVTGLYVAQNLTTWNLYETIQGALDDADPGDAIQVDPGLSHHEQFAIPSGVTVLGDTSDPNSTAIISYSVPVVSFNGASSGSSIEGFTIRYSGENLTRDGSARQFYIDIGDGSSGISIDKCLIGRDGYVSGWSGANSRYLATTLFNDGGISIGEDCSDVSITNCKIRYLTGPGISIATGSNDNITISNNHIYRNILPWDVRSAPYIQAPGIGLNGTARATIMLNEIYSNNIGIGSYALTGTDGTAGNIYVEGNVIHHNNYGGIGFNVQSASYFRSAEIVGNDVYSNITGREGGGIRVHNAYDLKIRENLVHNNGRGIYVYRTYDAELDNNEVYSNNRGFLVSYAYRPKIRQNYIHNNGSKQVALTCDRIYDFEIYNNKITWNGRRNVFLQYANVNQEDQSFFYKNIVDGSDRYGVYVYRSGNTVYSGNVISRAGWRGVCFNDQRGPTDFRHNKVINNGRANTRGPGLRILRPFSGNIFKNLFVANGWPGIRFDSNSSGDLEIYNNTIADNGKAGTIHRGAGIAFDGGLTTSTYSLFHNIFAFNAEAGYRYGDETWPQKERWDWVDKHDNFFFWNHGSLAGGLYNQERTQFINAQWGGPGGSGTDDITMEQAHWDYDQNAWDFFGDPDDPYSLDPLDNTGVLELADGYPAGAYSEYLGRSASYTTADPPDLLSPEDSYMEPIAVDPPAIPIVPVVPSPFPE